MKKFTRGGKRPGPGLSGSEIRCRDRPTDGRLEPPTSSHQRGFSTATKQKTTRLTSLKSKPTTNFANNVPEQAVFVPVPVVILPEVHTCLKSGFCASTLIYDNIYYI